MERLLPKLIFIPLFLLSFDIAREGNKFLVFFAVVYADGIVAYTEILTFLSIHCQNVHYEKQKLSMQSSSSFIMSILYKLH